MRFYYLQQHSEYTQILQKNLRTQSTACKFMP